MNNEIIKPRTAKKNKKGQENLKQRAYLNTVTGMLDYVITQLTGFIVSPFLVNGLGSAMYGIWQMLGQMTGYANVADTRATQVLKWTVAKKKDIASEEELRSDVSSAFAITLFVIPIILVAGGIVSWYAPTITKAAPEYHDLIRITCSLLILSLVVAKLFDLYQSVLRGMNLDFKRMGLKAAIVAIGGGLKVFVITQGYGLIGLSVVHVLIAIIIGITYYVVVKEAVGWFGFGKTNLAKIKGFGKTSSWYLADTGANVLLTSSDKILLGFVTSPVLVTYYGLTLFVPLAFQGIINRVMMGIVPGIGKLFGLSEFDKINKALKNINSITFLLTTAAGVTVIIFNHSFLNIWVGEGYFTGSLANTLIMVMVLQDTFIRHDAYVISATLDLKKKVFLTLSAGIMFILLGFLLVYKFEIVGLILSMIIGKFLLFNGQRKIIRQKVRVTDVPPLIKRVRPLLVSLTILGLAGYISSLLNIFSLLEMLILAPITFLITFAIYFIIGLTNEDRRELINILTSIKFLKSD